MPQAGRKEKGTPLGISPKKNLLCRRFGPSSSRFPAKQSVPPQVPPRRPAGSPASHRQRASHGTLRLLASCLSPTADLRRSCNGAEPWHPSTSRSRLARSNANSASTPPKRRQRRRLGRPPRPRHKPDERPWSRQSRQRRQVRPGSRTPRRRLRASRRTAGTAEGRRTGAPTSTPTSTSSRRVTGVRLPSLGHPCRHHGSPCVACRPRLSSTSLDGRPQVEGRPVLQRRPVLVSAARSCVYPVLAPIAGASLAHATARDRVCTAGSGTDHRTRRPRCRTSF